MIGSPRELLNVCFVHINDVCLFVCLESSSSALKIGSYILLAVGCVTMVMGFLGCLGAVNEVKCLLGLYFTCLLLILIAQVTAGVLIYIQRHELRSEMSEIIHKMIVKYNPDEIQEKSFGQTWDYIQKKLKCCGWNGPSNWTENLVIKNSSLTLYPCSCQVNETVTNSGFCKGTYPAWPVNNKGCITFIEEWIQSNIGTIFGVCIGVAVIELLGMILSMCLCKNVEQEDYSKVPKY
uniref:Tetraspanin n=1 Tax=Callorhinchus milii TaxID=7868 RepID=A0A4W3II37_CALMI